MKKKIHPKDQTKEIVEAHYEFMQRNPEQKSVFDDILARICRRLKMPEDKAQKLIKADLHRWHKAARDGQYLLKKSWINFVVKRDEERGIIREKDSGPLVDSISEREWVNQILKDSVSILRELILSNPIRRRIVVINLERSKDAIMAELEEIVTNALKEYQEIFGKPQYEMEDIFISLTDSFAKNTPWFTEKDHPYSAGFQVSTRLNDGDVKKKERLKWLPITPELLEVWDLYEKAGQHPWLKTFRNISRKVGRPLSTVKDQWCQAFEKIYGKKYTPEIKYATEEKRRDADVLCVSCPYIIEKDGKPDHAKCQRRGDWYPCSEYLSIAGKAMSVESVEYDDDIDYSRPNHRKSRKNKHE